MTDDDHISGPELDVIEQALDHYRSVQQWTLQSLHALPMERELAELRTKVLDEAYKKLLRQVRQ